MLIDQDNLNDATQGQADLVFADGCSLENGSDALNTIEEAIEAIAAGEMVVVVDDTDRENEGDLIIAASKATTEKMGFMIRYTSGIICTPIQAERARDLHLDPMVSRNSDSMGTAFTVSVDYREGLTTGISATERAATVRAMANSNVLADDFTRPGHVFPLIARRGGVLVRSGHTEAGVDLVALAGLEPAAAISEIVGDNGQPMRLKDLIPFAREHGLKIVSIEDLIAYRLRREILVNCVEKRDIRLGLRRATVHVYETPFEPVQHLAFTFGDVSGANGVMTRIHREDPVEDLVDGHWFSQAMKRMERESAGMILVLRSALAVKPGLPVRSVPSEDHTSARMRDKRWKQVGIGAQMMRDLGVRSIRVLDRGEKSYVGLSGFGLEVDAIKVVD